MATETAMRAAGPRPRGGSGLLGLALGMGAVLRLLAAFLSDPAPGDDAGRLAVACRWALHPGWMGLSGVWSPLHTYLLGGLIRVFGDPIAAARALGFVATTATLPFFHSAVREAWRDRRSAAWATLLLAIYYVHIWCAGTAYAEGPYLLALVPAIGLALRAANAEGAARGRDARLAGLAMAVAVLLRHEGKLVWALVALWLAMRGAGRAAARFAVPGLIVILWQVVEPSLHGRSVTAAARLLAAMKAAEVALHGSRAEALRRWILMPAGSPGILIVALGGMGLWLARRTLARDLFALLFVAQVALYLGLTIYPGWQPYLRYLLLYFIFLLPHAGLGLAALERRGRAWGPAIILAALLLQGVAWSRGRNEGRPLGWLPIYRAAPEQRVLDAWVREHGGEGRTLTLAGYPPAWDATVSVLRANRCDLLDRFDVVSYDELLRLGRGGRVALNGYDRMILDPGAEFYAAVRASLPAGGAKEVREGRLEVMRLGR